MNTPIALSAEERGAVQDGATPGPFTVRENVTGKSWFVETPKIERLALFRNRADAERFAGINTAEAEKERK